MFCCLKTPNLVLALLFLSQLSKALPTANPPSSLPADSRLNDARNALPVATAEEDFPGRDSPTPSGPIFPPTAPLESFLPPETRHDGPPTTCDGVKYTAEDTSAAMQAACQYFRSGLQAGMSVYPHFFTNQRNLLFHGIEGPFQEFPLVHGGPYAGGHPGADRIIINGNCEFAGAVTHSGARVHQGIVPCAGTS